MPLLSSKNARVRAFADADIIAGDVVWVTDQQGSRKRISKASALSAETGATAVLLVASTDAQSGELITVASAQTVTHVNILTGELEIIPEVAGGSLGDTVYLSDIEGKVSLLPGLLERPVGHVINDFSWEFNGSIYRELEEDPVELADLEVEGSRTAQAVSYPELLATASRIETWLHKIHAQLADITGEEDPLL